VARTDKAVKRYKKAVGLEWVGTSEVASRLGTTPACVQKTLAKYHAKGILERRNAGGAAYDTRFKGYEWRVK
jgi:predicted transcriptional regulator